MFLLRWRQELGRLCGLVSYSDTSFRFWFYFWLFQGGMKKKRDKGERSSVRREVQELRKELRTREAAAITQILKHADVVLSTNTGEKRQSCVDTVSVG